MSSVILYGKSSIVDLSMNGRREANRISKLFPHFSTGRLQYSQFFYREVAIFTIFFKILTRGVL